MKYEIAYLSLSGNAEKLAHGIADSLPHNQTLVTNLAHKRITSKADIYIIGFGMNKGTVPIDIINTLDELQGKRIMFFVTCGLDPSEKHQKDVEKKLFPFMPDDCDYCGLFMCRGKIPDNVVNAIYDKLIEWGDNQSAMKILEEAALSENHPDSTDIENACAFISKHI